jgi:hypothetical protein
MGMGKGMSYGKKETCEHCIQCGLGIARDADQCPRCGNVIRKNSGPEEKSEERDEGTQ